MGESRTDWTGRKLVIIHTTPLTVEPLKGLALAQMPGIEVVNLVDDSVLPQLAANGGRIADVRERWSEYARIAERLGADCILNACSSIGELCAQVQPEIGVPIVRIDEAVAEFAVGTAAKIGVAATLATTLEPTQRQLRAKAEQAGRTVELVPVVASTAYQLLLAGDKDGHDNELAETLRRLAADTDVVVLAQASMARVAERFSPEERQRFLTSPELGMKRVKETIAAAAARN
ncbi:aspartate/glutamate racemase family protein [Paenibacillus sacheonensis]|uniref:Asp/Glu racemase n=1 Tax=Paenibacillus sacheonensis TaxID=742054 RepID=A0A7X4YL11_9BACL|nr:aspartate/glutamate racemase family protein [Paenibacillus sacheonensis]MBM7564042.1 Asp/Glu/hydantoin racemase [Paenibacillus sacheonensis]NBC67626.1 Asp/Glu racemase [Paenibacillus sacheonensis]